MRIGFFVNDIATEHPNYTSTSLALEAVRGGHEAWYLSAPDFVYDADDRLHARARSAPKKKYESNEAYLKELQGPKAVVEKICVEDLDILLLRSDPAAELIERPWAQTVGVNFGQMAAERGVIVLNDPQGLAKATNKLYFQQFPEEVRPRTIITRHIDDVRSFLKELGGRAILKPLQGSGGQNVFQVTKENSGNLSQMADAVFRDGYAIVQEYLPAADKGDTRFFLLNGAPFEHEGKYAALARIRAEGDVRSNMHAGGKAAKAKVTDAMLHIAEIVRPKLVRDGMFLVGLDIAGDKLMEINVFSPGGLHSISKLTRVNFGRLVIEALERKLQYEQYDGRLENAEVAVL
jgi:glutathione synthase